MVATAARSLAAVDVIPDPDLTVFEADHGSPSKAVVLGRETMEAAPSAPPMRSPGLFTGGSPTQPRGSRRRR